jgi:hypothetical protein
MLLLLLDKDLIIRLTKLSVLLRSFGNDPAVTSLSICQNPSLPLLIASYSHRNSHRSNRHDLDSSDVVVWNWQTNVILRTLQMTSSSNKSVSSRCHRSEVSSVAISSNGKFILTGTNNNPRHGFVNIFFETLSRDHLPLSSTTAVQVPKSLPRMRLSSRLLESLKVFVNGKKTLKTQQHVDVDWLNSLGNSFLVHNLSNNGTNKDPNKDSKEEQQTAEGSAAIAASVSSSVYIENYWKEFILLYCLEPTSFEHDQVATTRSNASDPHLVAENCLLFQLALTSSSDSTMMLASISSSSAITASSLLSKMIATCPSIVLIQRIRWYHGKRTPCPVTLLTLLIAVTKE